LQKKFAHQSRRELVGPGRAGGRARLIAISYFRPRSREAKRLRDQILAKRSVAAKVGIEPLFLARNGLSPKAWMPGSSRVALALSTGLRWGEIHFPEFD
jgi:hypothetical protein